MHLYLQAMCFTMSISEHVCTEMQQSQHSHSMPYQLTLQNCIFLSSHLMFHLGNVFQFFAVYFWQLDNICADTLCNLWFLLLSSALMLLVGRQEGHLPVKTWVVGCCVIIYLEWGADLHVAQLMPLPLTVSCFSKIQIGFTFLVPSHPGSPGQRAVKRVCGVFVKHCLFCHNRLWWK